MNSNVENLYKDYKAECNTQKQEKILRKIFQCYEPLQRNLSYKYSRLFPCNEADDWKSLICLGIWEGVTKATSCDDVRRTIYYRVKHQISKEIQLIVALKQTYFHETALDSVFLGTSEELEWIRKIDIENAIEKLPERTKKITKLWMSGLPVLSGPWYELPTGPCIKKEVGLQDCTIYKILNEAFDILKPELKGYEYE